MGSTQTTDPKLLDAYDALPKGNCSRHHVEAILRIRTSEYSTLVPTVEELLKEHGVVGDQNLAGTAGEQTKQGIVNKLRDDSRYKTLLRRALDEYDEKEDIVNRALGKLVLLVNAARKKRVKTKGKSHDNTTKDANIESPVKSATTSSAVTAAPGVGAVPSVVDRKPQEPFDVIISYNGSGKLVASLADLVEDEDHLHGDESKITAKDLSLARLKAKAIDMFEEVITATEQISYFRCYIRGFICDIKTQGDLMGVARRVNHSKSDLSLEIVISKGKSCHYTWTY